MNSADRNSVQDSMRNSRAWNCNRIHTGRSLNIDHSTTESNLLFDLSRWPTSDKSDIVHRVADTVGFGQRTLRFHCSNTSFFFLLSFFLFYLYFKKK